MSSLQCPARLFLASPGAEAALAKRLHGERVARVWCGSSPAAVRSAEMIAELLGVDVVVHEGLRDPAAMAPGGDALGEISDQHPGEAVLVIGPGADRALVEVEVGPDGWRLIGR